MDSSSTVPVVGCGTVAALTADGRHSVLVTWHVLLDFGRFLFILWPSRYHWHAVQLPHNPLPPTPWVIWAAVDGDCGVAVLSTPQLPGHAPHLRLCSQPPTHAATLRLLRPKVLSASETEGAHQANAQ
ncbi:hypothetical protein SK128_011629, partial [Halocaridina rubra]